MRVGNVAEADVMCAVWLPLVPVRARSSRRLSRIRSLGLALPSLVASAESVLFMFSSLHLLLSLLHPRAWSVALLLEFFVCSIDRFS